MSIEDVISFFCANKLRNTILSTSQLSKEIEIIHVSYLNFFNHNKHLVLLIFSGLQIQTKSENFLYQRLFSNRVVFSSSSVAS